MGKEGHANARLTDWPLACLAIFHWASAHWAQDHISLPMIAAWITARTPFVKPARLLIGQEAPDHSASWATLAFLLGSVFLSCLLNHRLHTLDLCPCRLVALAVAIVKNRHDLCLGTCCFNSINEWC